MMNVSVLMSIYAGEQAEYLREALESLSGQTVKAQEVVLVEDGKVPEELKKVVASYREDLNIRTFTIPRAGGLTRALNRGLSACKGSLIARMDADDISLPERFEKQGVFMRDNPDISVTSSWVEEFDEEGKTISYRRLPLEQVDIERFARSRSPINHPAAIFRKKDVLSVGGYPPIKEGQDYALFSLMLKRGYKFANIPEVLLRMRITESFYKKRGKGVLSLLLYQKKIGFLSWAMVLRNAFARFAVRAVPVALRKRVYLYVRRKSIF